MFCPKCGMAQTAGAAFCISCGQSQAPGATVPVPPGTTASVWVEYAGFWRRFGANFIDGILVNVVSFIAGLILGGILVATDSKMDDGMTAVSYLIGLAIGVLYYGLCESSKAQATLGKMALGVKVTDMDGKRISFGRALGRYFGKIVSGLILGIGYLMIAFTEKKQGLHDMMAGTLVVKK
jgi:uncharacterized RDD family membrane protein YckC